MGAPVAYFGTQVSEGFDFTLSPGITPSVCSLRTIPHTESLPSVADLQLHDGIDSFLTFRDCLLEEPRLIAGPTGQHWRLPVKDRRWKWRRDWAPVYGHFNVKQPSGSYVRERTPQWLAAACLEAMGEIDYQVGNLPNDSRPEVHWEAAHAPTELDSLCHSLGCIIVFNPFVTGLSYGKSGRALGPVFQIADRQLMRR